MRPRYSAPFRFFEVVNSRSGERTQYTREEDAREAAAALAARAGASAKDMLRSSKFFYAWETIPGRRGTRRVSTRATTLFAARKWVQDRNREGRASSGADKKLLGDALGEWDGFLELKGRSPATRRCYRSLAVAWRKHFGPVPVGAITPEAVERHFRLRSKRTVKEKPRDTAARTLNKDLVVLRSFLRWARRKGYVFSDPTEGIGRWREPKREPRALSPDEVAALLRACREPYVLQVVRGKRKSGEASEGDPTEPGSTWSQEFRPPPGLYPAVVVGLTSLLRLGNVLGLRWGDLDFLRDEIRVPAERVKTREELVLPLAPSAKRTILELPKGGADDLVFGVGELKRPFTSAVKRAGLRGVTFHALRRTGTTHLRERGIPLEVTMRLGGWSAGGNVMLKHYRGVGMEELRKAVGVLDGLVSGRSEAHAAAKEVS